MYIICNTKASSMQDMLQDDMTEFIRHFLMRDGYMVKKNEIYFTLIQKVGVNDVLEYLKQLVKFSKLLRPTEEQNEEISKS